jgi:hypothetical protein
MPSNVISSMSFVCNVMNKNEPYSLTAVNADYSNTTESCKVCPRKFRYVLVLIMQFYHKIKYIFTYRPLKVENLTSAKIYLVPVFW